MSVQPACPASPIAEIGLVVARPTSPEEKAAAKKGCESVQNAAAGAPVIETDS